MTTRSSLTVFENTSRIPALGSTALIPLILDAQSGWESNARVKMPVPAPILLKASTGYRSDICLLHILNYIQRRVTFDDTVDI